MHNTKLSIVSQRDDPSPLRTEVDQIVKNSQQKVIDAVRKWVIYWAELGHRRMPLDECPGINRTDYEYVTEWLRAEGFTVHVPRWWGRAVVELTTEKKA